MLNGFMTKDFHQFVDVPTGHPAPHGDTFLVVLLLQKVDREAIESCGATLVYLPPYSPNFHPTELVFAKLKGLLRSAEKRTVPDL